MRLERVNQIRKAMVRAKLEASEDVDISACKSSAKTAWADLEGAASIAAIGAIGGTAVEESSAHAALKCALADSEDDHGDAVEASAGGADGIQPASLEGAATSASDGTAAQRVPLPR